MSAAKTAGMDPNKLILTLGTIASTGLGLYVIYDIVKKIQKRRQKQEICGAQAHAEENKDGITDRHDDATRKSKPMQKIQKRQPAQPDAPIYRICVTGGPCAGKTSGSIPVFLQ
jgi:hypothetical protein